MDYAAISNTGAETCSAPTDQLPSYSVLMSVYRQDVPSYVAESIDSMISQTWMPDELVIVIDGPITGELRAMLEKRAEMSNGLIRLLTLPENVGLGLALQVGIGECRNDWIARMDSDDVSALDRCEKELRLAMREQADIVGCDCAEFQKEQKHPCAYRLFPGTHEEIVRFSKHRTPFCHPAVMMKKSRVLAAGNYRSFHLVEDYDLFVRMLMDGCKSCSVQEVLFYVRVSDDFYSRRSGLKYVEGLLRFNLFMLKNNWTTRKDFLVRSGANIVVGLSPLPIRIWIYQRLLRK